MLAYEVGDRSVDTGLEFLENLRERLASPVHLVTDGYKVYLSAVEQVFGEDADHALRTEGARVHVLRRAAELDYGDAPLYPQDQRLLKAAGAAREYVVALLCALQLCQDSFLVTIWSGWPR